KDLNTYNRVTGYFSDLLRAQAADEPAALMRDAQGPSVYVYRFDWDELPDYFLFDLSELLGACHGLEMFFVFRTFDSGKRVKYAFTKKNYPGRKELSDAMSSYWAQFAYSGDPGRGRQGDLPEWKPWNNSNPGKDKFIVFDTEKDGGIRMSSEMVTSQDIKDRLIRDHDLIASQKELCRLYAHLFLLSFHPAHSRDEEEYLSFGEGGCKSYPPEMFR
ncbi:MAG: carboxylesterase family protein, partial [Desulfobacteraceae bacterium]|nr:carboxylesterase family protein [Desulfobacteraceae bacterium]